MFSLLIFCKVALSSPNTTALMSKFIKQMGKPIFFPDQLSVLEYIHLPQTIGAVALMGFVIG